MTTPRWSRWYRPVPAWLRIAVVCIAAAIVLGVAGARVTIAGIARGDSPGRLMIGADQRTLSSEGSYRCGIGTMTAEETTATVTIRLSVWPEFALGDCAPASFAATLKAPLGSRRLVDGVTHAELPPFDGGGILRPTYLPPGFSHRYDTALFPSGPVGHVSASCVQLYARDDADETIWITQDMAGGVFQVPDGVPSTSIVVHGHPGIAIPGVIAWTENGQLFTIRSVTYPYATRSLQDLVAIGDSLR